MDAIKMLALGLLLERLAAVFFLSAVVKRQVKYLREHDLKSTRWLLFALACALLVGSFVPILIDTAVLFAYDTGRGEPCPLGIVYAVSNATIMLVAAFAFWLIYRLIEKNNIRLQEKTK